MNIYDLNYLETDQFYCVETDQFGLSDHFDYDLIAVDGNH